METPGVGSYDLTKNSNLSSPKVSYPKTLTSISGITVVQNSRKYSSTYYYSPGPGEYSPSNINARRQPSISIRGKPREVKRSEIPGPGQYNLSKSTNNCGISFTKAEKNFDYNLPTSSNTDRNLRYPGPGSYHLESTNSKITSFKFSNDKKLQYYCKNIPGPGAYNISNSSCKSRSSSYSIGKSLKKSSLPYSNETRSLGPGSYNLSKETDLKYKRIISVRIGNSQRNLHDFTETPGVGNYNLNESNKPKTYHANIPRAKRELSKSISKNSPGPGMYNTNPPKKTNGFSFNQTSRIKIVTESPGPADYEIKMSSIKPVSHGCKVAQSKRHLKINNKSDIPGPNSYNCDYAIVKKSSYNVTFGKASKQVLVKEVLPGPGYYNLPRYIRDFSMLS